MLTFVLSRQLRDCFIDGFCAKYSDEFIDTPAESNLQAI